MNYALGLIIGTLIGLGVGFGAAKRDLSTQLEKDRVIIRVLLTYHKHALGQNLNPDLLYKDGIRWVDDPRFDAVPYPLTVDNSNKKR